ncbi:Gfo/Idh/MocA family protein [Promicromonospora sp. NPDC050880]|uniref:Gfo/Idh/MocA family protein n=1 Tax=Promicromonospora sp. NPDC050880 TaxID=3364406 RepID=UPI0037B6299E
MNAGDGATYAPAPLPAPVVEGGEFVFAAVGLDHGHIYGMCEGLIGAGATLKWVYDPSAARVAQFRDRFPDVRVARDEAEILNDPEVQLVAGAAITNERCALGLRVIESGKDYFTDKAPLTTLEQLASAREAVDRTGRKYAVYYSERIHVEAAVFTEQLIEQGAIGRVLQVVGFGPHRLNAGSRPDWFFQKDRYGGILTDIGSHNVDQILYYTGSTDARVVNSQIANYAHPEHPELDDFGDANLVTDTGATGYFRCDWFTPDGLQTWGDGRTFILGTEGFIEQRKYMNLGTQDGPGHVYLANGEGETHFEVSGKVGYPYFGKLIRDCLERTENAMTQAHAFKSVELAIIAQDQATDLSVRR